jgi:hypothetical protein
MRFEKCSLTKSKPSRGGRIREVVGYESWSDTRDGRIQEAVAVIKAQLQCIFFKLLSSSTTEHKLLESR